MNIASGESEREAAALADSLTSQVAEASPQQEQTVPLHVIQAMRDELRAEKEKNEAFRNHLQMMQWNRPQQQEQRQPNPFGDADPEDSIKVKDAARLMSEFENRTNAQLAEIKLAAKTPDYREVIQKFLPKAAQEDPELLDEIKRSPNPYKTAYLAAKASQAYQDEYASKRSGYKASNEVPEVKKPKPDPEAERMIENSRKSGNLASVGNNAKASGKYPSFSQMGDEEFRKYKAQNLFGNRPK